MYCPRKLLVAVKDDNHKPLSVLPPRRRARDLDGDKFQWALRPDKSQLVLTLHHGSSLGTLWTVVYRSVDLFRQVEPAVFQSHEVLHSAMSGVSSQSRVVSQGQKMGLEWFQHDRLDCTIYDGLSHKESNTA